MPYKQVLAYLFLSLQLLFSNDTALALQKKFKNDVVLYDIYKEHFDAAIHATCKGAFTGCYEHQLATLIRNFTPWENSALEDAITQRLQQTQPSKMYWLRARNTLRNHKKMLKRTQFITLVDLHMQRLLIALFDAKERKFYFIGMDTISSGDMHREKSVKAGEDHYLNTPTGIFTLHSAWRSEGKVLSDGITLPYGKKGRIVFYFGKQKSVRFNTFTPSGKKIKNPKKWQRITDSLEFAIHAHQSSTGFGKAYSHGCVRIRHALNEFMDNHLVLSAPLLDGSKWTPKYCPPPKSPKNLSLAGSYLIVVDKLK